MSFTVTKNVTRKKKNRTEQNRTEKNRIEHNVAVHIKYKKHTARKTHALQINKQTINMKCNWP